MFLSVVKLTTISEALAIMADSCEEVFENVSGYYTSLRKSLSRRVSQLFIDSGHKHHSHYLFFHNLLKRIKIWPVRQTIQKFIVRFRMIYFQRGKSNEKNEKNGYASNSTSSSI